MLFGAFTPQGWKMELASVQGAEAKWAVALDTALAAERLGYDSVWVYDHMHNVPVPSHEAVFECWTTVAALAQARVNNRPTVKELDSRLPELPSPCSRHRLTGPCRRVHFVLTPVRCL